MRGTAGLPTAIWLLLTRTLSLLTLATGAAAIRHYMASDRLERVSGAASRMPWAVIAMIVGGFGLAGLPLTAQFASRWALLQLVAEEDPRWALLLLFGALGVVLGSVRAGRRVFRQLAPLRRLSANRAVWRCSVRAWSLVACCSASSHNCSLGLSRPLSFPSPSWDPES